MYTHESKILKMCAGNQSTKSRTKSCFKASKREGQKHNTLKRKHVKHSQGFHLPTKLTNTKKNILTEAILKRLVHGFLLQYCPLFLDERSLIPTELQDKGQPNLPTKAEGGTSTSGTGSAARASSCSRALSWRGGAGSGSSRGE